MVNPPRLDIMALLRSLAGDTVYYVPNTGNAGDGLIAYATLQAFRRVPLAWVILRSPEDAPSVPAGSTVVLGGGGQMVRYWNDVAVLAGTLHRHAGRLVILPHTIEGNEAILAEFGPNVDVVCREETSYHHVVAHARGGCRVHLSDDMAFLLDVRPALRVALQGAARARLEPLRTAEAGRTRTILGLFRDAIHRGGEALATSARREAVVLNCFRSDVESAGWAIPSDNFDVSAVFASHDGRYGEADAVRSGGALLRYVNRFDVVNTDRLHVAIAGALLGKRVRLHVGSYYKIAAVYGFSMRDRFPRVSLVPDPPA